MKAKFRLAAVLLALLMVLSASSVLLVACNNNSEPTTPPSAGTTGPGSLVTAQSLVDSGKLKVMYPFEDSGRGRTAAVDPYTGETLSSNRGEYIDATLVDNPDAETASQSAKALSVRESGFTVGKLSAEQMPSADGGLSVSFWAYNDGIDATQSDETAGTLAFDFMNVVTNGTTTVTWGNIRSGGSDFYPGLDGMQTTITVGRGAYSDAIYPRAQANRSQTSLSRYAMNYTGYNAIAGNAQTKDARESVTSLAEEMEGKWRYVTIVFDKEVGISFYANGRLAYCYSSQLFTGAATGGDWDTVYTNFVSAAMEDEDNYELSMFNDTLYGEAEVYVDDVIVGLALTAAECEALYEGLSGTDVDASLTSTMSSEDQAAADAATAYVDRVKKTFPVEGDAYGPSVDENVTNVAGKDVNGDGKIDDAILDAKNEFVATYKENKADPAWKNPYIDEIGSVDCDTDGASLGQGGFYKPAIGEDGTFEMTVSGIQLASGVGNFNATYVTLYSGSEQKASVRVDWSASNNLGDFIWDTSRLNVVGDGGGIDGSIWWKNSNEAYTSGGLYLNVVQRYCALDIILAYDGEDLTVTYEIYYYFAGQQVTDNGVTFTVPKDDTTLFNTVTYTIEPVFGLNFKDVFDMNGLSIKFGAEDSAYLVQGVEGGERQESAPASTAIAAPSISTQYTNSAADLSGYANVKLPAYDAWGDDTQIVYTADVYTIGNSAYIDSDKNGNNDVGEPGGKDWYGPAFILVGTEATDVSSFNIDNTSDPVVYVRADDFAISKNTDGHSYNVKYNTKAVGGAYAYTLTKGEDGNYTVSPLKFICVIERHGNNFLVTYYRDSVDDENIIRRAAVTFKNTNSNLFLFIGGESTYMENISVTIDGTAATPSKTTSGAKR